MLYDLKLQPAQIDALQAWTDLDGATLSLTVEGAVLIAEQGDDRAAWAFDGTELTNDESAAARRPVDGPARAGMRIAGVPFHSDEPGRVDPPPAGSSAARTSRGPSTATAPSPRRSPRPWPTTDWTSAWCASTPTATSRRRHTAGAARTPRRMGAGDQRR